MDKIELIKITTHLKYEFEASGEQLLVFSEMYYPHGWSVSIDQQKAMFFPSTMYSEVWEFLQENTPSNLLLILLWLRSAESSDS